MNFKEWWEFNKHWFSPECFAAAHDAWEAATKAEREASRAVLAAQSAAHHREVQEQVASEREACAKICDGLDAKFKILMGDAFGDTYAAQAAQAIRSRGQTNEG